jgi:hypothetical protein
MPEKNFTVKVVTNWILRRDKSNIIKNKQKIIRSGFLQDTQLREIIEELAEDDENDEGDDLCKELLSW